MIIASQKKTLLGIILPWLQTLKKCRQLFKNLEKKITKKYKVLNIKI
jgi:hypothetical protein